jgi:hypothetical protein
LTAAKQRKDKNRKKNVWRSPENTFAAPCVICVVADVIADKNRKNIPNKIKSAISKTL